MLQISDESGTAEGRYEECSEYENLPGHVLNTKYLNDLVLEVQRKTGKILIAVLFYFDKRNMTLTKFELKTQFSLSLLGITDTLEIHRCLEDNEYDVESTCTTLIATNAQNIGKLI